MNWNAIAYILKASIVAVNSIILLTIGVKCGKSSLGHELSSLLNNIKRISGLSKLNDVISSAKQAELEKKWDVAAELYAEAFKAEPANANWSYRQGLSLERAKRFDESVVAYEKAIELEPRHDWWFRLGISAEGCKNFQVAKQAFRESLDAQQGIDPLYYTLLEASPTAINSRFKILEFMREKLPEIKKRVAANNSKQSGEPKVFTYWDTGFVHTHPVVQACYREMVKNHNPGQIIALDASNWKYYVDLPAFITEKLPTNKAHFSDVLRVALLAKYGGIWADATCMPATNIGHVFHDLAKSGFFSYSYATARISNWFLCTSGDNYVAKIMYESMVEYWKQYDYALHYYFFHHIFEILYHIDERFKKIWDESTKSSSKEPHDIQKGMMNPFNKDEFNKLYAQSFVHKLTYKFKHEDLNSSCTLSQIVRGDF